MSELKIAVVELTSGEDISANVDQILEILSSLPEPVDLICLPENSLYFRISNPIPAIGLGDSQIERLSAFAGNHDVGIMIGSVPVLENQRLMSATVFLEPGRPARTVYQKLHLFDVDVAGAPPVRESESFRHGVQPAIVEWRGWKLGLSICYDLRFTELFRQYGDSEVDVILIPSAFLVPTGKAHWDILVRARAIENQCYVAAAAQGGEHQSTDGRKKRATYGHSMIVNPWGEKLVELTGPQKVGVATLVRAELEKVRRQIPMREHRHQRRWEN